jgi:hypothetical protein
MSTLKTVTDAIPPARVVHDRHPEEALDLIEPGAWPKSPRQDTDSKSLERSIEHLDPGKNRKLELTWRPDATGHRTHTAQVIVSAAVGSLTEVVPPVQDQSMPSVAPEPIPERERPIEVQPAIEPEPARIVEPEKHPGLSFDVQHQPRAIVEDLVEMNIVVRNTGDVPLHDVRVVAQLPDQLKHRRGQEVEYVINRIPVSGSERAILRVVAETSGRAVCHVHVASQEAVESNSKAIIDVEAKPARPEPPKITKIEPAPKPRPNPTPAPTHAPAPKRPTPPPASSNCCCQMQPAMDLSPWSLP